MKDLLRNGLKKIKTESTGAVRESAKLFLNNLYGKMASSKNSSFKIAYIKHGVDKRGFIYADTDSIHCDLQPEEIKGIEVHDTDFCNWHLQSCYLKQYKVVYYYVKQTMK